jgi:quercetin dioxygenase-like cupin family protein
MPGRRRRNRPYTVFGVSIEKGLSAVRSELFGGRGEVRVWSLLDTEAAPFTAVLWCELAPGGSVGRHVQEEFAEVVIGVAGQGEATVDDRRHGLSAGDAVYLPLGSVLAIENRSEDAPLRYLIVKARG